MSAITMLENDIEIVNFLSELRDKNNENINIKVINDWDIDFENNSQLDLNKTKFLLQSIIDSKIKEDPWPKKDELLGRCKIIDLCGSGFTSNVYKAIHEFLGIEVAVKVLSEQLKLDNPEIECMFLQEARNTAKLKHPNLVSIFDANKGEKYTYMIMEFVDGYNLEKLLKNKEIIEYKKATQILIKLCDALEYALEKGIIHRDIKPGNIMISNNGDVKLLDLGLSKIVSSVNNEENNNIVGTPVYMSPEQFIDSNSVDHRTDIYSLGATFFHLITGELPFKANTFKEIIHQKIISDDKPKLDEKKYPANLILLMNKLLDKDKDLRYQTYSELKHDLRWLSD